jgi:phospholipase C
VSSDHCSKLLTAAVAACIAAAGGLSLPAVANQDSTSSTKTPIKHVVVIFGENESFDHYFGTYPNAKNSEQPVFKALPDTPSVNGLTQALLTHNVNLAAPKRLGREDAYTCSMNHDYTAEQKANDGGLMDKFVQATAATGEGCASDGSTVMDYYDGNTVTALWNYAQHYAMNDNSYGTNFGPSTVGAVNEVSGMTGNAHLALTFAKGKVATFSPVTLTGDPDPALDDCGADAGGTATGKATVEMQGRNIGDILNLKGVTWGWFEGGFKAATPAVLNADGSTKTPATCPSSHTGHQVGSYVVPNPTINFTTDIHIPVLDYSPHHQPFQYYVSTRNPHHLPPKNVAEIGHNGQANHQYDISDFYTALNAGNLPAVTYLKAPRYQDAHPGNSDPITEQAFIVTVINALQQSPDWKSTAVFIQYDDSDGWYDHQAGPILSPSAYNKGLDDTNTNANDSLIPELPLVESTTPADPGAFHSSGVCGTPAASNTSLAVPRCGYGPRLPFLVVSPWAKANFVDHSLTDQTSSIRFIEENWGLEHIDELAQPLAQGSMDRLAGSVNNMFDFSDNKADNSKKLLLDPVWGTLKR